MVLPVEEVVIPSVIFGIIILRYIHAILTGAYAPTMGDNPQNAISFFKMMRAGWIKQNHLTGQAACNTTRDYIRVVVFLAGNAVLCASILSGFASNNYRSGGEMDTLALVKIGICVAVLLLIFVLLLLCMRYILHFR